MTEFVDRWSWCAVQVTLFAIVGTILYLSLRKQNSLRALLPARCLYLIAVISLLAFAPWPHWNWLSDTPQKQNSSHH